MSAYTVAQNDGQVKNMPQQPTGWAAEAQKDRIPKNHSMA